ncbi:DNA-directed RNA polymerase, mitochondrial isoform X1 [Anastrepha ludens]|uniref:DNA-directed RNA polymerase, mitochondrial isoform X1 n=1 Tax=Anastrepha ludens TaxID=28586 RepID=UPI0023B0DC95|nr:DNA-directed RNA polymerase, mitochondrial isoform X1 [Anastrepha ludens]
MHRIWSAKWTSVQNVRLLLSKCPNNCSIQRFELSRNYSHLQKFAENYICGFDLIKRQMLIDGPGFRSQSTIGETLRKKKKRIVKPRYSKYVELLEVTDKSANERKSRVKRLRAKKLQAFIAKTQAQIIEKRAREAKQLKNKISVSNVMENVTPKIKAEPAIYKQIAIDEMDHTILESGIYDDKPLIFFGKEEYTKRVISNTEDIKNIIKSFNNYRDIIESVGNECQDSCEIPIDSFSSCTVSKEHDVEELLDPLVTDEPFISSDSIELNTLKHTPQKAEAEAVTKSKTRFKSKVHNSEEQERFAKEKALRINLEAYLNVCVSAGMVHRGMSTLLAYRQRAKKKSETKSLITIDFYNTLLHGLAEKGSFERFEDIFTLIEEDELKFNEQTFAAIFECLGRVESSEDNIERIRKFAQMANKNGITLNQIMDRSVFTADQRDIALDAIRRIEPDFSPIYTPPVLSYNNKLLDNLNEHILPVGNSAPKTTPLSLPSNKTKSKREYDKAELQNLAREQLKVELDGCITIKSIESSKELANAEYCRGRLKDLEELWRTQISAAIIRDLNTLRAQIRFKPNGFMNYYTYLKTLDTSIYTDILIKEIYKLAEGSETFSPTVGQLYKELGQQVQKRYQVEMKKKNGILEKIGEIYSSYCDVLQKSDTNDNTRQMWQRLVHEQRASGPSMDAKCVSWPPNVQSGVGRFLYNILMRDIKIDTHIMRQKSKIKQQNVLPAFYTLFRNQGRLVKEEVKPHPVLARLLRTAYQKTLTFDSSLVPMLCPPQPWSTPNNGGYLLNKSDLIRLPHQAIQQWERINSANPQQIYPALDSLNQLSSVAWRVNTDILDVIIKVFQNGGDEKLDIPQPPSSLPPLPSIQEENPVLTADERSRRFKAKLAHRRKQGEMYSLWCDTLYRLSLANHYRNRVFWLPHNMDFRGRVYPIPPHLNHLGSDLARSMLVFDQAQPLGADGFSWLKLHCINLTGIKKRDSVRERLLYAEDILNEILDSADNPLDGNMWWTQSDEPWQTLACCMEIAKVYRSNNAEGFLSRFPIHQDGSCNGLQHYAALGRDEAGAKSVNLAPSPLPQDVYSAVAALVEKSRKSDAAHGIQVAQALESFVRRKVIKQTVMTTVYGVTRYGARLQIARQLKDIENFPKEWVWPASTYLTSKTFESLREMFTSTREIQDWFTECARLISGVCGQNVEWITPLGLPVVQPYNRQEVKHTVRTSIRVSETMAMDMYEKPNVMKQKNAFPPNFIHSLDSSHMMLTSLYCEHEGLTFVSVHDCFWTHACTVPEMNKICREQFVSLHSQPILENLSTFMRSKYSFKESEILNDGSADDLSKRRLNRILGEMPRKGNFDLRNVLNSVYFFS